MTTKTMTITITEADFNMIRNALSTQQNLLQDNIKVFPQYAKGLEDAVDHAAKLGRTLARAARKQDINAPL